MNKCFRAFIFIVLLLVGRTSSADPIAVGDLVRFVGSEGTLGGGAFHIDNTANGAGVDFLSFCLQLIQHVDYSNVFRVGSITNFADDAGGPDYLSTETAWLFSTFRSGGLSNYTSNEIQASIWILEDEWTTNVGRSAELITMARANVAAGWVNNGVGVLNLFYTDGHKAQDQLTQNSTQGLEEPVPEPGTLALLGIGAVALFRKRRQASRP